ncbi:MAG TPA: hypothetical protein VFI41_06695 [Gemmatimonadales bacterium]|jgi:hypothetical protein|nr:hypothetical protein [Gemmatimonadales bacterium]
MPPVTLRPLSFGEIVDHGVNLFRRLFVPLVLVQVICTGIIVPLQAFMAGSGRQMSWLYVLMLLASFVLSGLASAAVALIISENYLGRRLDAVPALQLALPKLGAVIMLSLAVGVVLVGSALPALLAMGGAFAFMAPAITGGQVGVNIGLAVLLFLGGMVLLLLPVFVFSGLALSTPALVLEDLDAGTALRRSWTLTKGSRLRVVGLVMISSVIIMIPIIAIGFIGGMVAAGKGPGPASVGTTAATSITTLLLTPLVYCVLTLLYYDLRVRKEAFDLEVLASSLAD